MTFFGAALSLAEALFRRPATTLPPAPVPAPSRTPASPDDDSLLEADLIRDEGIRTRVYRDTAGKRTIGVGHNIDADRHASAATKARWLSTGMTPAEAHDVLKQDIAGIKADMDHHIPWWRTLDHVRRDALTNMGFNMGINTLLTFRNTLAALQRHDWATATYKLDHSKWDGQVKGRADRIEKMILTGAR